MRILSLSTAKSSSLEPWFGPHLQRNIYLSLLHLEQTEPGKEKPITVPDSVLKAALLRRATEDIHRIISIRNAKQALATLLQRGSVGDDLWQRFLRAEKEVEEELKDVVNEVRPGQPLKRLIQLQPYLFTNIYSKGKCPSSSMGQHYISKRQRNGHQCHYAATNR